MGARRRRVHTEKMDAIWIYWSQQERKESRQRAAEARVRMAALKQKVRKAVEEKNERGQVLERQAVTLYRQYGFILPGPAKVFFRELAIYLNWQDLMKVTK